MGNRSAQRLLPGSKKIPSTSTRLDQQNVRVDLPVIGDVGEAVSAILPPCQTDRTRRSSGHAPNGATIDGWRAATVCATTGPGTT